MYYMLYATAKDSEEAKFVTRKLVEEKLIACANIFPINSIYWWNNEINEDDEFALILKTNKTKINSVIERIKELHSYDVPCIVAYKIVKGNKDYLQWINQSITD